MAEIERKQGLLRREARSRGFKLKTHDHRVSHLEGIIARGDVRTASLIEKAWTNGARFDGWDEHLAWSVWLEALDAWEREEDVSRDVFLRTLPVDGRLSWDHIDVGLEDGFLLKEYRRTLQGRFSPPCGKPVHTKVHHTNLEDARADERKLVCYHCGVACDLTEMREERLVFLEKMGAEKRPVLPEMTNARGRAHERVARGLAPHDFSQGKAVRYRIQYAKTGPMSLRGHLDFIRVLTRVLRRAELPLYYTEGFSPRPLVSFGPALGLGMQSVAEYADLALTVELPAEELRERIQQAAEPGLSILEVQRIPEGEPSLARKIDSLRYLVVLPEGSAEAHRERLDRFRSASTVPVTVRRKGKIKTIDAKTVVLEAELVPVGEYADLLQVEPESPALALEVREESGTATLRPSELAEALLAHSLPPHAFLRTGCGRDGYGSGIVPDSRTLSPTM